MYEARIIPVRNHLFLEMADIIAEIENYRACRDIAAVALQPDSRAEAYLRQATSRFPNGHFELGRAGHDVLIIRYAQYMQVGLLCLGEDSVESDVQLAKKHLDLRPDQGLAAVVTESSKEFFEKALVEYGFRLV